MSQRNPMNDRYQTDEHKGKTRKSAASVKPKTKAASSVRVQSVKKTPQEKKAVQKQERAKQRKLETKYYNPPTAEFKKWRKLWWVALIGAIVMTGLSFLLRMIWPEWEIPSLVVLAIGYVGIIGALVLDFTKIRKLRQAYQAEMQSKISKEERALAKQEQAEKHAAKKAAQEAAAKAGSDEESEGVIQRRKGLFSFTNLRFGAERASKANKAAAVSAANESDTKGK